MCAVHVASLQLCLTVCDPMDCIAHQAPLSVGFSRQEYWSGLPCPPPGDLPDPGIEPHLLYLMHWQADSLPLSLLGSPIHCIYRVLFNTFYRIQVASALK